MEIRKVNNYIVSFDKITQGEVFLFNGEHYMRMEEYGNCINAVNLFTGEIIHFSNDEIVAPVDNCYLAIE